MRGVDLHAQREALRSRLSRYQEYFPYFWETDWVPGIATWGWIYGATWSQAPESGLIRNGNSRPALTHIIRGAYRDICENITGDHPRIYRQVPAGCNVGCIAVPQGAKLPGAYRSIAGDVPVIRQLWVDPPMIIDPPMNRRSGRFEAVAENPVRGLVLEPDEWLCYPAMVGPLQVHVYFHTRFMGLGCALANPFELAADERLAVAPDALLFFGVPLEALAKFGDLPTVFHEDEEAGVLVGAVPNEDRFGYFGYLKKLSLTLHNVIMMRRGRMPFHGAMVHIALRGGRDARLLILGDTATGKSESLYAFGQIDRAIIMSPQKVNARVVLPVTTLEEVLLERFESDET